MAKYYGAIGFLVHEEDSNYEWDPFNFTSDDIPVGFPETDVDVHAEKILEKPYFGDIIKDTRKWQGSEHLNDNLTISNRISVIGDPYAFQNFHSIKYITWMGSKWKVKSIEVAYPRLILDVGGVYHEQTTGA